ncbi:hypothetical protein HFP15_41050 [Amycolatopsis sp. K13G38]|uniref:Enoyl-CoA hydratase/isomerase family protein n=1 Tax=Amycolatopsis acididurans TaxID=2724524 RepID=A0ABX1JJ40_9PSEU|nr:enoyl-CoA hydratase-related protein [Amycolatopsis acididurans]NKQ59246.1 hypothetical protein [Amycolatopsis acididurans]
MGEVRLDTDAGVAVVTLAASQRRNALTSEMSRDLIGALDEVDTDPSVGAIVIRGEGSSFCSGAHLATLAGSGADPTAERAYGELGVIYESFVRVGRIRAPTPAASGVRRSARV